MKYATIENLLFSIRNVVTVEKKMGQFNNLFKMLLNAYEEYNPLLEDETRVKDDEWFNEIYNQVFFFNRKMCWLKNAGEENKLKNSSTSSRSSVSKTSKSSKISKE